MLDTTSPLWPEPRVCWRARLGALAGLGATVGLALSIPSSATAQSPDHPNILFVAVDDLNDWVGPLRGFEGSLDPEVQSLVSPNLDRLAAAGVTFTQAQTTGMACNPARAALLSGISPVTSGLDSNAGGAYFRNFETLRHVVSLPQHLKKPDGRNILYTIKTTGKIWHSAQTDLPSAGNTNRAFTEWDEAPGFADAPLPRGIDGQRGERNLWDLDDMEWTKQIPLAGGRPVTDPALIRAFTETQSDQQRALWAAQLVREDAAGGAPQFIALGIFRPHLPWRVPGEFFDRFPLSRIRIPNVLPNDLADIDRSNRLGLVHNHPLIRQHATDPAYPGETDVAWRLAIQAYLASVAFADDAIGKVLVEVEAKNRDADPTNDWTVVLWSDHGYHLGEKERWQKYTLWEETGRSLVMVWKPGLTRGGDRVEVPVDFLDVFPTVAELAGAPALPQMQGRSFVDLLRDPLARRDGHTFTTHPDGHHAVRSKRWRYIRHPDTSAELYDRFHDPDEFYNLLHPQNAAKLAEFGLPPPFIESVRRAHSTALFDYLVRVHSRALSNGDIPLERVDTLGRRTIDRFGGSGDLAGFGWTQTTPGRRFMVGQGAATPPAEPAARATHNALTLDAGEDFLLSAAITVAGDTAGLGLTFGYRDAQNFYELLLVNERSTQVNGVLDLRLVQRADSIEDELLRVDDLRRLDQPTAPPLDLSRGAHTLVVSYTAASRGLEVIVQDGLGVNLYRGSLVLETPIEPATRFGIASWSAQGGARIDDFVALSYPPVQTLSTAGVLELDSAVHTAREGDIELSVTVRRNGASDGAVSVDYAARDLSAWQGLDYELSPGTLTWGDGDASERRLAIAILSDSTPEIDEQLEIALSNPTGGAVLGAPGTTRVTILDDDPRDAPCAATGTTLCLNRDRFAVTAEWQLPNGATGSCQAVKLTDDSGYCWFFRPDNVEAVVKVLDACTPFDAFWVFAAGLTNVRTALQVRDTASGALRRYDSPQGIPFAPLQDTKGFATCP